MSGAVLFFAVRADHFIYVNLNFVLHNNFYERFSFNTFVRSQKLYNTWPDIFQLTIGMISVYAVDKGKIHNFYIYFKRFMLVD